MQNVRLRSQAGVTAIELAVVLGIMSVLTVAMISAGNLRDVAQARGGAEQVTAALHQARTYAVMQSATYQITFPGGNHISIACAANCAGGAPAEGPTVLGDEGIVTAPETPVSFTATGTSTGGTLVVRSGASQRTITVTRAGRIQATTP
jgi:Tfp pilus assembly protein FimT